MLVFVCKLPPGWPRLSANNFISVPDSLLLSQPFVSRSWNGTSLTQKRNGFHSETDTYFKPVSLSPLCCWNLSFQRKHNEIRSWLSSCMLICMSIWRHASDSLPLQFPDGQPWPDWAWLERSEQREHVLRSASKTHHRGAGPGNGEGPPANTGYTTR